MFSHLPLIRLGTLYGGWWLPKRFLLKSPNKCVCIGAGEDISYDLVLSAFSDQVYIIDPTQKALDHWITTLSLLSQSKSALTKPDFFDYLTCPFRLDRISFISAGVHGCTGKIDFYPPENPNHSSYSTENLQNTDSPIKLHVLSPLSLAIAIGTLNPDILKLDIEGAELPFLQAMFKTQMRPVILQVEFDSFLISPQATYCMIDTIFHAGYHLIHRENRNFCFMNFSLEQSINSSIII